MTQEWMADAIPVNDTDWLSSAIPLSPETKKADGVIPSLPSRPTSTVPIRSRELIDSPKMGPRLRDEPIDDFRKRKAENFGVTLDVPDIYKDTYGEFRKALEFSRKTPQNIQDNAQKLFQGFGKVYYDPDFGENVLVLPAPSIEGQPKPEESEIRIPVQDIPGFDPGDLPEMMPGAIEFLPELGGALIGGILGTGAEPGGGTLLGGAAGSMGGAYTGTYARLKTGQKLGYNDLSDTEIQMESVMNAAITGGVELGTLGLAKAFKPVLAKMFGASGAGPVIDELTEKEVSSIVSGAKEFKDKNGFNPTLGQAAAWSDIPENKTKSLLKAERQLFERGESPELAALAETQQQQAKQRTKTTFDEAFEGDIGEGARQLGEDIQRVAAREVTSAEMAAEKQIDAAVNEARENIDLFTPETIGEAGSRIQEQFTQARENLWKSLSRQYDKLEDATIDMQASAEPLKAVGEKWKATIDKSLLPTLSAESSPLAKDAAAIASEALGATDFDTILRSLSDIKREIRRAEKGDTTRNVVMLRDMRDALESMRRDALSSNPEIMDDVLALEKSYAGAKNKLERGVIAKILKQDGDMYKLSAERVPSTALKGVEAPSFIKGMADDPLYAEFDIDRAMKNGIMAEYDERVLSGSMSPDTFFSDKNYGEAARKFLGKADLQKMRSTAAGKELIQKENQIRAQFERELSKKFSPQIANKNTSEVFDYVMNGPVERSRDLKNLAEKYDRSDIWDQYKAVRMRKLFEDISKDEGLMGKTPDPAKIREYLDKDPQKRQALNFIYGKRLTDNLGELAKLMDMKGPIPSQAVGLFDELLRENPAMTAPMAAWRAFVARPLSRAGLATTSAMKLSRGSMREAMGRVMADPENLQQALVLFKAKDAPPKMYINFFRKIGAMQVADEMQTMTDNAENKNE